MTQNLSLIFYNQNSITVALRGAPLRARAMSMASSSSLATHSFYTSFPLSHRLHLPEPYPLLRSSLHRKPLSLSATSPSSSSASSSSPIFLSFFDDPLPENAQEPDNSTNNTQEEEEEEEEEEGFKDPILKFFKSRTLAEESTEDPSRESKFSLQKNRRTSWHLASDFETDIDPEPTKSVSEANQQTLVVQTPFESSVPAEILEIAKNLTENQTLGEMLSGFEGKINETECVEALVMMGESGFVKSCLYFYEWMSLQNPSLASPRACSVLFTLLGRESMADKILPLLRNLPDKEEFRDVRLYNAAISGLSASQRYFLFSSSNDDSVLGNDKVADFDQISVVLRLVSWKAVVFDQSYVMLQLVN